MKQNQVSESQQDTPKQRENQEYKTERDQE